MGSPTSDFELTSEVVDETGPRTQRLMAWYCRKNPELAGVLTEKKRARFAAACKRMVLDYDADTINDICVGIYLQYPYAPPDSRAFTPMDMERVAEKCIIDGRRERARLAEIKRRVAAHEKHAPDRTEPPAMRRTANDRAADEFFEELREKQALRERLAETERPSTKRGRANNVRDTVNDVLRGVKGER